MVVVRVEFRRNGFRLPPGVWLCESFIRADTSVASRPCEIRFMKQDRKIRYAVIGLGHLSQVAILPAFAHCRRAELGALITGDEAKGRKLSRKYGVPAANYDDLEMAFQTEQIEAVYIVLPNTLHRSFTERAARAGAHVLCEKPLATTEKDALAMIHACEKAGVKLMTACLASRRAVRLRPFSKEKRPGARQEIKRPPVRKEPPLVGADAPHH